MSTNFFRSENISAEIYITKRELLDGRDDTLDDLFHFRSRDQPLSLIVHEYLKLLNNGRRLLASSTSFVILQKRYIFFLFDSIGA